MITTMTGFLVAMTREYGSRKTGATLKYWGPMTSPERPAEVTIEEYFDDGKGHSGAFWGETRPVLPELFERAKKAYYVSGKLEPGYVSTFEFEITEDGTRARWERWQLFEKVIAKLWEGPVRARELEFDEVRLDPPATLELAKDLLEYAVDHFEGLVVAEGEGDEKQYRIVKRET